MKLGIKLKKKHLSNGLHCISSLKKSFDRDNEYLRHLLRKIKHF